MTCRTPRPAKTTGQVLQRQSQTTFTAGTARSVSAAGIGNKTATTLDATLTFLGSSDTGHVRWTFVDPAVVQVKLTSDNASPTTITEAFLDQGEHNYGLWEYSYYGTGGALDNRGANNHPLLGSPGLRLAAAIPAQKMSSEARWRDETRMSRIVRIPARPHPEAESHRIPVILAIA